MQGAFSLSFSVVRATKSVESVLPDEVERTKENYKREILKLRIENETFTKDI